MGICESLKFQNWGPSNNKPNNDKVMELKIILKVMK